MHVCLAGACFSLVAPTPVRKPTLVASSLPALSLLGLHPGEVGRPELLDYLSGNKLLPGSQPAAHCYCGHQFGHFSGQLGDGCAMYVCGNTNVCMPLPEEWALCYLIDSSTISHHFISITKMLMVNIIVWCKDHLT